MTTDPLRAAVRAVRDDDSAALIALIRGCFEEYPGCVLDVDAEEPWLRAPATAYGEQSGRMWVATGGDDPAAAVIACIGCKPAAGQVSELKNLYVAASARRHGLGATLTGLVERSAREAGHTRMQLWTDSRFTAAHRLYQRLGYVRTGRARELHDLSATTEYHFSRQIA